MPPPAPAWPRSREPSSSMAIVDGGGADQSSASLEGVETEAMESNGALIIGAACLLVLMMLAHRFVQRLEKVKQEAMWKGEEAEIVAINDDDDVEESDGEAAESERQRKPTRTA